MVEINRIQQEINQMVSTLFRVTIPSFKISWDANNPLDTEDPFGKAKIFSEKIVFQDDIVRSPYYYIDITRALVVYALEGLITHNWTRWNFATLIALLIIPSTKVSDSKKTQYRKLWLENEEDLVPGMRRFNYLRWYHVLSSYSRTSIESLLQEFIGELPDEGRLEINFVRFLHEYLSSYFSNDDIAVLITALQKQTIKVSEIQKWLPEFSTSKLYRIFNRLQFHLDEYYIPNPKSFGLTGILLVSEREEMAFELQHSEFYENMEEFKNTAEFIVKYWIPSDLISELIENISLPANDQIFIKIPSSKKIVASPDMYDSEKSMWNSVHDTTGTLIEINEPGLDTQRYPTNEEIKLLLRILRSRTTDYRKLSVDYSQKKTKTLINNIQSNNYYYDMVLWRYPSDLQTISIFLPSNQWIDHKEDRSVLENLSNIDISTPLKDEFEELLQYTWPYTARDLVVQVDSKKQKIRPGLFIRIVGRADDLLSIMGLVRDYLIGIHQLNPGSMVVIPVEKYNDGEWNFDLNTFLSVIG